MWLACAGRRGQHLRGGTRSSGGAVTPSTGTLLYAFPNASSAAASTYRFDHVSPVAVDSAGNIYVADEQTSANGGTGRVVVLSGILPGAVTGSSSSTPVTSSTAPSSLSSSLRNTSSTFPPLLSTAAASSSVTSVSSSSVSVSSGGRASSVVGDPMFVGLRGQTYQVHGLSGQVYNLIVDSREHNDTMRVNARFVHLSSGRCPAGAVAGSCWSHPGSYLQEVGVWTAAGDRLIIRSGDHQRGYANVTLNGFALRPGGALQQGNALSLLFSSSFVVQLTVGNFHLEMHNSDGFINLHSITIQQWSRLTGTHGLLGQTWRLQQPRGMDVKEVEGYVDEYVEQDNELLGGHFVYHGFE